MSGKTTTYQHSQINILLIRKHHHSLPWNILYVWPNLVPNDQEDSNFIATTKSFSHMDQRIATTPLIIN